MRVSVVPQLNRKTGRPTGVLYIRVRSALRYGCRADVAFGWTEISDRALKMPRPARRRFLAWVIRDARKCYQELIKEKEKT